MGIRNEEVRRSIEDLLALVANYPRENKGVSECLACTAPAAPLDPQVT